MTKTNQFWKVLANITLHLYSFVSSLVFLRGSCVLAAPELVLLDLLGSLQLGLGLLSWTLTLIIEEITAQCIIQSTETKTMHVKLEIESPSTLQLVSITSYVVASFTTKRTKALSNQNKIHFIQHIAPIPVSSHKKHFPRCYSMSLRQVTTLLSCCCWVITL